MNMLIHSLNNMLFVFSFLTIFNNLLYSQDMKKITTKNYVYYDINKSEKNKLMKEFVPQQIDPQKVYHGDSAYLLNDGIPSKSAFF